MHLILIQPNLMLHLRLLGQQIDNLPPRRFIQQTILRPQRQTQRLAHRIEIPRHSNKARMRSERRIHPSHGPFHLAVRLEDGISTAPAESHGTDLVGPGRHAHGVDEAVYQRFGDSFAVCDEPGAQGCRDGGGVGGFFRDGKLLLFCERGLHVLQEGDGQGIAFVEIREVGVEAREGVLVGEEAGVVEFPAEDFGS